MVTTVLEALNGFIGLFVAGTVMFIDMAPATFKKFIYLAGALILLPIAGVAAINAIGDLEYWVSDLVFMHGGSIGIPVTFGYGLTLGLLLNKLRRLIKGDSKAEESTEDQESD